MSSARFREVTWDDFYARLQADPRDIMPCNDDPNETLWRCQKSFAIFGKSTPGWRRPSLPKTYLIAGN
jgi:hypothetical protein